MLRLKHTFIITTVMIVLYSIILTIAVTNFKGTVLLKTSGGIGNQLFQFASAYAMAKSTNSKLYIINTRSDDVITGDTLERKFLLDYFHIEDSEIVRIIDSNITKISYWLGTHPIISKLNESIFKVKLVDEISFFKSYNVRNNGLIVIKDYFESDLYFKDFSDEIKKLLQIKKIDHDKLDHLLKIVSTPNNVCVHVRRGDFLHDKFFELYTMSIDYQKEGIRLMQTLLNNPEFYVFSDSIKIAQKELNDDTLNYIEDNISGLETLFVMQNCAHNIIANSTLSWWSAYLNITQNHYTIAPKERYKQSFYRNINNAELSYWKKALMSRHAFPDNWITLDIKNDIIPKTINRLNITKEKEEEILKHYSKKEFNIYTGTGIELNLCINHNMHYICNLNNNKQNTVVTAYYNVDNKGSSEQYDELLQRFLKMPFNLVMYTDKASADKIKKYRGDLPIHLIIKELDQLEHYKVYQDKLNAKNSHNKRSSILKVIWSEKIKFVNDAIKLDYYDSDFFIWCDISIFQDSQYIYDSFPLSGRMIHNKISFAATSDFTQYELDNKLPSTDKNHYMIAGCIQVGDKVSWMLYEHIWDNMVQEMINRGIEITHDSRIINAIALNYPNFINLIYPTINYTGNRCLNLIPYFSSAD